MKLKRGGKHGLTPRKELSMPKALAIHNTPQDYRRGTVIDRDAGLEMFALLEQRNFLPTEYFQYNYPEYSGDEDIGDLQYGDVCTCYITTQYLIDTFGGIGIYGWLIENTVLGTGFNKYAHTNATAHAVWQSPEGNVYETISNANFLGALGGNYIKKIIGFIPHNRVKRPCRSSINFLDKPENVNNWRIDPNDPWDITVARLQE